MIPISEISIKNKVMCDSISSSFNQMVFNFGLPKCTQCKRNEGTDFFIGTKSSFLLCNQCMTKNKTKQRIKKLK